MEILHANRNYLLVTTLLLIPLSLNAQMIGTVNVDLDVFGFTYHGQGAYSTPGNEWNGLTWHPNTGIAYSLVDTLQNPTPYAFSIQQGSYVAIENGNPTPNNSLFRDFWRVDSGALNNPAVSMGFQLQGFVPFSSNSILVYGVGDADGIGAAFTFGNTTLSTTGRPYNSNSLFTLGVDYQIFPNVIADAQGNINATWSNIPGQSQYGAFNGLQILSVPEPSTVAMLLSVGIAAMGFWYVKKRNSRVLF
ncbi:MAG: PEP-CTERM sorting domain-containing protein [Gemmatales bacterium]